MRQARVNDDYLRDKLCSRVVVCFKYWLTS